MPGLSAEQIARVDVDQLRRRRAGDAGAARGRAVAGRDRRHRARAERPTALGAVAGVRHGRQRDRRRPRAAPSGRPADAAAATVRGYELPPWATPDSVVLCASYSGNTEETLACYEAAGALGATRVVVTTGGRLAEAARADGIPVVRLPAGFSHVPRWPTCWCRRSRSRSSRAPRRALGTEVDAAAARSRSWPGVGAGADRQHRKGDRRAVHGHLRLRVRAGPTAPSRPLEDPDQRERRSCRPSAGELPEADHNESSAGRERRRSDRSSAIFLEDADQHPRIRQRIELTAG